MNKLNFVIVKVFLSLLFTVLYGQPAVQPFERMLFQDPEKSVQDFYLFQMTQTDLILFYKSGEKLVKRTSTDS